MGYRKLLCTVLSSFAICVTVGSAGELPPLSDESKLFRGEAPHLNRFCFPFPGCQAPMLFSAAPQGLTTKNVLGLFVDTNDHRYNGSAGDLTAYRDAKLVLYEDNTNDYWLETSWGQVGTAFTIPDRVVSLPGAFDDYYNRQYVQTALTSTGISFPLDGSDNAEIHVRDGSGRNRFVDFAPTANDIGELVTACQDIFDSVPDTPSTWVECSADGSLLRIALTQDEVDEATFIRPTGDGGFLSVLGLFGPVELPGDDMTTPQVTGKPIPGSFPVTLTGGPGSVSIEVRAGDKYPRTRTYDIPYPSETYNTPQELVEQWLLPVLNQEFDWVEYVDVGATRVGLLMKPDFVGDYPENASIRITGGVDLDEIGLNGPLREDGVITFDKRRTVRGSREDLVAAVLSIYLKERADEEGIPISGAGIIALNDLVDQELSGFDSMLVVIIDQDIDGTLPGSRRAGASSSGEFDIEIVADDQSFTYVDQVDSGFMIGPGYTSWQTWAHEIGHTMGFIDLYAKSDHQGLDGANDYVNDWGIMDNSSSASHTSAWHKFKKQTWFPGGTVEDINPPNAGATDFYPFTLVPIEYPASDYAGVGSAQWPERQLLRLMLSEHHWLLIENRQPGAMFSQSLPDDLTGDVPPNPSGEVGGLLVTDACDYNKEFPCLFRPYVIVMNPHGNTEARGLAIGETWPLDDPEANPGYDGIVVRDMGAVPGPAGKPEARQVEVEWGPGEFLELEIRPWEAPEIYGTHDIWIDWPGNGEENYPNSDPPAGQGENAHWHPDGTVENLIKVRVHNHGTVEARDVVVRMSVNTPGGAGDSGEFVKLDDSDPQDIPPEDFRDFVFEWNPTVGTHTCLKAQLLTWDSDLGDIDLSNNEAQENVFSFDAAAEPGAGLAGPVPKYDPVVFPFRIGTQLFVPSDVHLDVSGLVPGVDIELEQDQLHMAPREEVVLQARITVDADLVPPEFTSNFIRINVHSLLETADAYQPFGGFTVDLRPRYGSSLVFRESSCFVSDAGIALLTLTGRLLGPFNSAGQTIDVAVVGSDGKSRGADTLTQADGTFTATVSNLPDGPATAMIYYWGPLMTSSVLGPIALDIDCGPRPPRPIPPTLTVDRRDDTAMLVSYDPTTCVSSDQALIMGKLGSFDQVGDAVCSLGTRGAVEVPMPTDDVWFLIGGTGEGAYSSLGQSTSGERIVRGVELFCRDLLRQDLGPTCE